MAIALLSAVGANAITPAGPYTSYPGPPAGGYVDCHSCGRNLASLRLLVAGTFTAGNVIFEHSPDSGITWFPLGSGPVGTEIAVERPIDWVRARTDGAIAGGTASAFMEVSA